MAFAVAVRGAERDPEGEPDVVTVPLPNGVPVPDTVPLGTGVADRTPLAEGEAVPLTVCVVLRLSRGLPEPVKDDDCDAVGERLTVPLEDTEVDAEGGRLRVLLPDALVDPETERECVPVGEADADAGALRLRQEDADIEAHALVEELREGEAVEDTLRVGDRPVGDSDPHALDVPVPGAADTEDEGALEGDTVSRADVLGERELRKPVCDSVKVALKERCAEGVLSMVVGMGVSLCVKDAEAVPLWESDSARDLRGECDKLAVMNPVRLRVPPRSFPKEPLGDAVSVLCNDSEAHVEREGSIEPLIDVERDADAENEDEGEERVLALGDSSAEPLGVEDGDAE